MCKMAYLNVLLILSLCVYQTFSICSDSEMRWVEDPLDCTKFYVCLYGERVNYTCPFGSVTDSISKACVPKGSSLDHCSHKAQLSKVITTTKSMNTASPEQTNPLTTHQKALQSTVVTTTQSTNTDSHRQTNLLTTIQKVLQSTREPSQQVISGLPICRFSGLFPVASNCAQYFQCTASQRAILKDCSYPKLFNTDNNNCEMPALVTCGSRYEPVDPCEYYENRCTTAHCVPCDLRFPSCRGLPDGLNPWSGRESSPYFAICNSQRVVFQGKCSYEDNPEEQIFDSKLRVCVKASFHSK